MQVLGGHVEHLVEGWDFQRRFAGNKAEPMASEDQARAPKFSHFVPGKTRAPSKYVMPSSGEQARPFCVTFHMATLMGNTAMA